MKIQYWCFIIVFVLVVAGTALYVSKVPDAYRSEALIGMDGTPPVDYSLLDIQEQLVNHIFLERLIESNQMYGYGKRNDFIMEQAVKSAQRQIAVARKSAYTVAIYFIALDPQSAQTVTRMLTQELIQSRKEGEAESSYHVVSEASLPSHAEYPNRSQIMLVGAMLGLIFGAVASLIFIFTKRLAMAAPKTS